ncbi:TPA: hypothetical protein HA344_09220 [Candidatus Bathyarchaeota archaeon]|nr:hypothetical protein [Candidatus Bathyarchaeota archaeon]
MRKIGVATQLFLLLALILSPNIPYSPATSPSQANIGAANSTASLNSLIYNTITLTDPSYDMSPGSPSYVDIKSLTIRQLGNYVQFIWEGDGKLYNQEQQYYFLFFDTDLYQYTGQRWGDSGVGAELKIVVQDQAHLIYFDDAGNVAVETQHPVIYENNKFFLNIDCSDIPSDIFNFYFESSGGTSYYDLGRMVRVELEAPRGEIHLIIRSPNMVLEEKPPLINIPTKTQPVQLTTYFQVNGTEVPAQTGDITYSVYHPCANIPGREYLTQTIMIDAQGLARYVNEGYLFVTAYSKSTLLDSEPVILATGDVYGAPKDSVLAVFPDYSPANNTYTFRKMMTTYPNYIWMVNQAYNKTSGLYLGFRPFNGDRQIFALLVVPGAQGGCDNPLQTHPKCYMDEIGKPQYWLVIHEMGHNFAIETLSKLLYTKNYLINSAGFGEGVASLPVIYTAKDLYDCPERYGLKKTDFEWTYYRDFCTFDAPSSKENLDVFEQGIKDGTINGVFDKNATFDGVATFCSFFQQYVHDYTTDENTYKQDVIRRFLSITLNEELIDFVDEKVETYWAAAFSAAVGHEVKQKLLFWGFPIDDQYYNTLYPKLLARADQLYETYLKDGNRAYLSIKVVDSRIDIASQPEFTIEGRYLKGVNEFQGQAIINDNHLTMNTCGKTDYHITAITDPLCDPQEFTSNTVSCVFDRVNIVELAASSKSLDLGEKAVVWVKATYEYDGEVFDGEKGNLHINGNPMTWSTENSRWEYEVTNTVATNSSYRVTKITDKKYSLSTINDEVGPITIERRTPASQTTPQPQNPTTSQIQGFDVYSIISGILLAILTLYIAHSGSRRTNSPTRAHIRCLDLRVYLCPIRVQQ